MGNWSLVMGKKVIGHSDSPLPHSPFPITHSPFPNLKPKIGFS
ncbi:hypothetical protein NIES4075_53750 [Tolypothrix sp. NIES-4075]|nr:hypothetical protein NIES4075_53750 [Tolypothrix sp. NIES-4075]